MITFMLCVLTGLSAGIVGFVVGGMCGMKAIYEEGEDLGYVKRAGKRYKWVIK